MSQKTRFHARMCLLGVKNVEINNEPLFMPSKVKFWQKKVDLENLLAENAGDAHLQTSLNRHRSSIKVV